MANLPNVVNVLKFRPRATHQDESTNLDSTGHKDREGFVVVEIKPGKRYKLEAQIAAVPTTLIWEFSTQDLDIAFSAKFQPKNPKAAPLVIRELRRVKCNVMARIGQFTCREPGAIHLVWDNRYSHFRKKQLYFRIYQVGLDVSCLSAWSCLLGKGRCFSNYLRLGIFCITCVQGSRHAAQGDKHVRVLWIARV